MAATGGHGPSRQEVVAISTRYLTSGLVDHDPGEVPLAPEATRHEIGINSGNSGEAIAASLLGEAMKTIRGMRNLKWVVEGNEAVCLYELDTAGPEPVHISEYFRVEDGRIAEIIAAFTVPGAPAS